MSFLFFCCLCLRFQELSCHLLLPTSHGWNGLVWAYCKIKIVVLSFLSIFTFLFICNIYVLRIRDALLYVLFLWFAWVAASYISSSCGSLRCGICIVYLPSCFRWCSIAISLYIRCPWMHQVCDAPDVSVGVVISLPLFVKKCSLRHRFI